MYTLTFSVTAAEVGARCDAVVALHCPTSTKTLIRRAIAAGKATVNGRPVGKGDKLRWGDHVAVDGLREAAEVCARPDSAMSLDVVYADTDLVAVNKPSGMACHPLDADEMGTVANGLVARYPEMVAVGDSPLTAGVLHRLDGETSGVVLAARSQDAFETLRRQFQAQQVCKRYMALVEGIVVAPARLEHQLAHRPSFRGRMVDAASLAHPDRAMWAVTEYHPVRHIGNRTLLDITIRTGVTHQIRCQLALAGHPVVGDTRYDAAPVAGFYRHFLHAQAISFRHPRTGIETTLHAPLTADLVSFLES